MDEAVSHYRQRSAGLIVNDRTVRTAAEPQLAGEPWFMADGSYRGRVEYLAVALGPDLARGDRLWVRPPEA